MPPIEQNFNKISIKEQPLEAGEISKRSYRATE